MAQASNWTATEACPYPDKVLVGWLFNYARRNHWRVARLMSEQDLTQEGFKVYCYCHNKYGRKGLPIRLFMALYQRSMIRRLNDLSLAATAVRRHESREADREADADTPIEKLHEAEASNDLLGMLMVIADAPNDMVRRLLVTFLTERSALLAPPIYKRVVHKGETTNQFVCRILGLDPVVGRDLVHQAKEYLYGSMTTA